MYSPDIRLLPDYDCGELPRTASIACIHGADRFRRSRRPGLEPPLTGCAEYWCRASMAVDQVMKSTLIEASRTTTTKRTSNTSLMRSVRGLSIAEKPAMFRCA